MLILRSTPVPTLLLILVHTPNLSLALTLTPILTLIAATSHRSLPLSPITSTTLSRTPALTWCSTHAAGLGKSPNEEKGFFYWWFLDRKAEPPSEPPAGSGEQPRRSPSKRKVARFPPGPRGRLMIHYWSNQQIRLLCCTAEAVTQPFYSNCASKQQSSAMPTPRRLNPNQTTFAFHSWSLFIQPDVYLVCAVPWACPARQLDRSAGWQQP